MNDSVNSLTATVAGLCIHPVKSCGGIEVAECRLDATGFELDRQFMVVDPAGDMLTQRECPRMALVQPSLRHQELVLKAPGMLALHVRLDRVEEATRARVWQDIVKAFDMGPLAAQWFTDFLGRPARLVRFDPDEQRLSNPRWTGELQALNAFSDGFPVLVCGTASLDDLNARLAARRQATVTMKRFRPNLVLSGLQAFDEDLVSELQIGTDEGPVVLRLVKPCARCTIPSVDPDTGVQGHEPGDTLSGFRADPRLEGAITFGMNAIIVEGHGRMLRVGQPVSAEWAF